MTGAGPAPARSTAAAAIELPDKVAQDLDRSGSRGRPLLVAYRDAEGRSKPTFRGSVHLYDRGRLCLWVRDRNGGLPAALGRDDHLVIAYRDLFEDTYYKLDGVGRLVEDPEVADWVYSTSPPGEQLQDRGRKGIAMIIDITRLSGWSREGRVLVESPRRDRS